MTNTLIIKTAAAGDVVRTTSLLNVLEGNIYWVTSDSNRPLLPDDHVNLTVLNPDTGYDELRNVEFDQVISLEEDENCARLASMVKTRHLTGVCFVNHKVAYTDNSAYWFD